MSTARPTRRSFLTALAGVGVAAGCKPRKPEIVVYTSIDQPFAEPVFMAFQGQTGVTARAVFDTEETKSTGVVNRLIAEGAHPQADVFWSGDPVRIFLLIKRGLVEPYRSPNAAGLPAAFRAPDGTWTGTAARARILLVNKEQVSKADAPRSLRDLTSNRWKGRTAIANPLYGTTTMHAAALFATWGDAQATKFFEELKANGTRVASSNGEVKRLVASGEIAVGLTDTDDAHEALEEHAPVFVVFPDQDGAGTLIVPTAVALLRGGPHPAVARRLIDYLLTSEVEAQLAQTGGYMPLGESVPVPSSMRRVADIKAMAVDYARIAETMERIQPWLRRWAGL